MIMERKVGEIFEYNGEWYQCIEGTGCYRCAFYDKNICIADNPHCTCRSDKKNVIFKKLKKVGDITIINEKKVQPLKTLYTLTGCNNCCFFSGDKERCLIPKHKHYTNTFYVEIKQNKENMEEKKLNLKEFNLEAAKAGKPVCTRDGRKARIISFDRHGEDCPIIALVVDSKNAECEEVIDYTLDGICNENIINHNKYDLMMFPQKKEGWVNVYKSHERGNTISFIVASIYPTKEEAKKSYVVEFDYVDTVKIEWEE